MFACSNRPEILSPFCMNFASRWWLYDLRPFHDFWKSRIRSRYACAVDENLWGALTKAYGLHRFSPLEELYPLAQDFLTSDQVKPTLRLKKIEETFSRFFDLGLKKIEHLERLSRGELERRFGKAWGLLWEGLFFPKRALWKWKTSPAPRELHWSYEFDPVCADASQIIEALKGGLHSFPPTLRLSDLKLSLITSEETALQAPPFSLQFISQPQISKDASWILRMLEAKLFQLELAAPLWRLHLQLTPSAPASNFQLDLFCGSKPDLTKAYQKLTDEKFTIFRPAPTFSRLPEESWKKIHPSDASSTEAFSLVFEQRPIFQEPPKQIPPPEGRLRFLERLTWFDSVGVKHQRDYYMVKAPRAWLWVFKNEADDWFKQGVME